MFCFELYFSFFRSVSRSLGSGALVGRLHGDEWMTMAGGRVMRPGHGYGSVALVQQFWSGIWNLCCRVFRLSDISTLV